VLVGWSVTLFDARADVSPEPDGFDTSTLEIPLEELPDAVVSYTLPSRFCPSDQLGPLA
jgi:hypothetical protein